LALHLLGAAVMTRRLTLVALVAFIAVAGTAHALTSRTRLCISKAKAARLSCRTMALQACNTDFTNAFTSCFGPGADCAAACISAQASCLTTPVSSRTACQKDTDPNPSDGVIEGACATRLKDDLTCCTDPKCVLENNLSTDPLVCASNARLDNFKCVQDCQLVYQPAVDQCNSSFNDCTQACASCRDATDCPSAAVRSSFGR
jgi:hypothetical protein